ncbi:MAG: zinc ribbon domain-containing protein [Bellilinea sp.]
MLLIGLVVIGVPLLIVVFVVGGLPGWLKSQPRQVDRQPPPPAHAPDSSRHCPTCGRGVQSDWRVCPSCGTALA